ncbi:unnamed protein product [Polarella glacialis]|uniref:MYND-type domain-containing protein n=1 Tax=Polarella glacialis TaxID=89957 RepID=A0A813LUV2_POLGL|nr:unnamed protein product [Polarella glacialis]
MAPAASLQGQALGELCSLSSGWRSGVVEACRGCGEDAPEYLCSRCRQVSYCGPACQRKDWQMHRSWFNGDDKVGGCGTLRDSRLHASSLGFVHTVWGLWDTVPLPLASRRSRVAAAQMLSRARIVTWSRLGVESLLSEEWRQVWRVLPRAVCQADVARYLIALHVGGLYLDADAELIQAPPGGSWELLLFEEQRVPHIRHLGPRESPHLVRIAQFMFATVPQHAFWRSVLELSLSRCRQLLTEGIQWKDSDVLWATGPDVVTSVFHEQFHSDVSIQVGVARDFVRHECQGAWRHGADRKEDEIG